MLSDTPFQQYLILVIQNIDFILHKGAQDGTEIMEYTYGEKIQKI
jgi:hypothetical protein